jgi:hypothetical protein
MRINTIIQVFLASAIFCTAQTRQNFHVEDGDLVGGNDTVKRVSPAQPATSLQKSSPRLRIVACLGVAHFSYNWLQAGYLDYFAKPYNVFNKDLGLAFTGDVRIMMPSNIKFCPFISLFYSMSQVSENSNITFYDRNALLNDTVLPYSEKLKRSLTVSEVGIGAGVSIELNSFKSVRIAFDPDILFIYGWCNLYVDKDFTLMFYKDKLYPTMGNTKSTLAPDYCVGACARSSLDVSLILSRRVVLQLQGCLGIQWTNVMRNGKDGLWKVVGNDGREREIRLNSLLTGVNLGVQFVL